MAGIENLRNRILKDDEEKAKEIEVQAKAKAEEILKSAKDKADTLMKDTLIKVEIEGKDRQDRIISRATLEARNSVLQAKQETIEKVLAAVEDKIDSMDSNEYSKFIEGMLLNNVETGDEEVIFAKKDKNRIIPGLIDRVNERLHSLNKKNILKYGSESESIKSGFILKHGGVEVNCSVDSQIRMLRDSIEGEIANLIFEVR